MKRILLAGPPCAGKSTLARRLAREVGGIILDLDEIAVELGSPSTHDHSDSMYARAEAEFERRLAALDGSAVVIRSVPERSKREALADRIAADRTIVLAIDSDTAKARGQSAGRPPRTAAAIDSWWRRYEESPHDFPAHYSVAGLAHGQRSMTGHADGLTGKADQMTAPVNKDDGTGSGTGEGANGGTGGQNNNAAQQQGSGQEQAREFTPVTTQEEFDRRLSDRLTRERAKYSDYDQVKADAEEYRKIQDGKKDDLTREREAREAAEAKAATLEQQQMRSDIAIAKGLTAKQAKRLTGKTREELEADADELLEDLGVSGDGTNQQQRGSAGQGLSGKPRENLRGGTAPDQEVEETDPAKLAAMIPRA